MNPPLRPLTPLFPELHIVVIGISRDGRGFVPTPDDDMRAGDEVYVVADTRHLSRTMAAFGHEEKEARRVIIIGGGNIGLNLPHAVEIGRAACRERGGQYV